MLSKAMNLNSTLPCSLALFLPTLSFLPSLLSHSFPPPLPLICLSPTLSPLSLQFISMSYAAIGLEFEFFLSFSLASILAHPPLTSIPPLFPPIPIPSLSSIQYLSGHPLLLLYPLSLLALFLSPPAPLFPPSLHHPFSTPSTLPSHAPCLLKGEYFFYSFQVLCPRLSQAMHLNSTFPSSLALIHAHPALLTSIRILFPPTPLPPLPQLALPIHFHLPLFPSLLLPPPPPLPISTPPSTSLRMPPVLRSKFAHFSNFSLPSNLRDTWFSFKYQNLFYLFRLYLNESLTILPTLSILKKN